MIGSLADAYLESTPLGSAKWLPEKGPVACLMGLLAKAYPGTMATQVCYPEVCVVCCGVVHNIDMSQGVIIQGLPIAPKIRKYPRDTFRQKVCIAPELHCP